MFFLASAAKDLIDLLGHLCKVFFPVQESNLRNTFGACNVSRGLEKKTRKANLRNAF